MQNFIESLGWKKVAIILVVVSVLFLGFIFISLRQPSQPLSQQSNQSNQSNLPKSSDLSNATGSPRPISKNVGSPFPTYSNSVFEIVYPPDFKVSSNPVSSSGSSVEFSSVDDKVQIFVEYESASTISVSKLSSGFSAFKYNNSTVSLAGVQAQKFSGSTGEGSGRFYDIAYIFQTRNKVFKLQLTYQSDLPNQAYENLFGTMINSFKLR